MAGYNVQYAVEFVPAAQSVYRLNHPDAYLDTRDVREITAGDILNKLGMSVGELDVFEGSPPCSAFSTAGSRSKGWGSIKKYSDTEQRVEDLFFEYARLLEGLMPRVFVAENVAGLVKGVAKGYFIEILRRLKAIGYNVEARVLDAQWLGVPQRRQRLIFIGVRDDLDRAPVYPKPLPYQYSLREVCPWITRAVHDTSGIMSTGEYTDKPSPTITVSGGAAHIHHKIYGDEPQSISEGPSFEGHAIYDEWIKLRPGEWSNKFFSLTRANPNRPSPTITAMAGNVGLAGVTHPTAPRKFSIAELKRICSFPDDFQLTGTYQQQWERLGRSVPPLMMRAVAEVLRDEVLQCAE